MRSGTAVRLAVSVVGLGLSACVKAPPSAPAQGGARIGVYDSRAIAIAWTGTPSFNAWMGPLAAEHERAKAAGDEKRAKELAAEGAAEVVHPMRTTLDELDHREDKIVGAVQRVQDLVLGNGHGVSSGNPPFHLDESHATGDHVAALNVIAEPLELDITRREAETAFNLHHD